MTTRLLGPCRHPGCPGKGTHGGYCEQHKQEAKEPERIRDRERGTAAQRGYGYRWQQASKAFLAAHPLCAECEREGRVTAATVVDHIVPYRGDMALFWDPSNWQPLCRPHHDTKTARGE